jgi:hypothetical protein
MDDDKFKAEVLSRLDRIVSLLSANCSMTKAALERAYPDLMKPKQPPTEQGETPVSRQILEEMQDDYTQAFQKWKSEKGL